MSAQARQLLGHGDEAEGSFGGPEALETERVESNVLLEFKDPILAIRSGVIDIPKQRTTKVKLAPCLTVPPGH